MSFDCLARHYRWLEFLLAGNKLQRCRTAYLPQLRSCRRILLLGEGNGRFLVECRRAFPAARVTCLDASPHMLARARRRLERSRLPSDEMEWIAADALTWQPPRGEFDLVATHFFLDCFRPEQLSQLLGTVASAVEPGGTWLLSDFRLPEHGPALWRAWCIHRSMYGFFRFVTRLPARRLTPPDAWLLRQGFVLRERRLSEWGLLHSDRWELAGGRS